MRVRAAIGSESELLLMATVARAKETAAVTTTTTTAALVRRVRQVAYVMRKLKRRT